MIKMKVYLKLVKTKDNKEYTFYSAKTSKGEWVDIVFSKKSKRPDVNSIIELENKNIFLKGEDEKGRKTYVIMAVNTMTPITKEIIEDTFFD